jgi:hypothetical protein
MSRKHSFPHIVPVSQDLILAVGMLVPTPDPAQPRNTTAMPTRRDALVAAVAAYNRAHQPLPNSAVRLLEAMFGAGDVCQQSREALEEAAGISRKSVHIGLRALLAAGVVVKEGTGHGRHASRYRLLLTVGNGA